MLVPAPQPRPRRHQQHPEHDGERPRLQAGQAEDTPEQVNTPGLRALYNNLEKDRDVALKIDEAVKANRPDGWRGVQTREMVIKRALYEVLQDPAKVERIFLIVKAQAKYS